jgi:4-amino-4-deoxy-L-arabinose transferase-like glycosyltransferase
MTAAGLGGLAIVIVLARRNHETIAVTLGIATLVATRAIAVAALPTPLVTDWADYNHQAILLANGGVFDSARAPGWPLALSLLYRVGGPNPLLGELLNLVCAVVVGLLLYRIARRWFGAAAAAAGLFLWAISPGPALFAPVLASEHLFTALFLAAVAAALVALDRRWFVWIPVGVLLALSQYVRPVGLVVLPAFIVLPFLVDVPRRRAAAAAITVLVAFAIALSPAVAWQYQRFGRLTLSTSNYDGWNLLIGLNVAHKGQYNRADGLLVGAASNTLAFRDRAYMLAIERLTANPGAVVVLAAPKFQVMWGNSTYGVSWTLGSNRPGSPRAAATMGLLSQLAYAATAVLTAAFLFFRRRQRDPVGLLMIMSVGTVALSEVLLEVQSRYHAFFEPLFCLFAGVALAWLAGWRRKGAEPVATSDPEDPEATSPDAPRDLSPSPEAG